MKYNGVFEKNLGFEYQVDTSPKEFKQSSYRIREELRAEKKLRPFLVTSAGKLYRIGTRVYMGEAGFIWLKVR